MPVLMLKDVIMSILLSSVFVADIRSKSINVEQPLQQSLSGDIYKFFP